MALDPAISDQLSTLTLGALQQGTQLNNVIDRNLTQGLGVINSTLIQQHGGVQDDPALFGALNTAAGIPASGYVGNPAGREERLIVFWGARLAVAT